MLCFHIICMLLEIRIQERTHTVGNQNMQLRTLAKYFIPLLSCWRSGPPLISSALVLFCLQQIAALIGADEKELVFTSGATESNNMALKGVARFYRASNKKHIITSQIVRPLTHTTSISDQYM